ncbi:MAG TPA: hypothetical protein VMT04_09100 [Terriglobales bacterium]|nr:hypothetical protein [Terriglobales bacterium]
MDNRILEDLNKRRFNSPEVLRLIIFRVLKIVLFCLSLTFLLSFILIQNHLLFTILLGIVLGISAEVLVNSRKGRSRNIPTENGNYCVENKIEEENKVGL